MSSKKISISGFTGFLLISFLVTACYSTAEESSFSRNKKMEPFIGTEFQPVGIIDTSGNTVSLNYEQFDMTIIDFWFSDCPGCLTEMKQFNELLSQTKKNVQIISISINSFKHWKDLFYSTSARYSFLQETNPKWKKFCITLKRGSPTEQ